MSKTHRAMNTQMFYLTVTLSASLAILVGCDDSEANARHRVECGNNLTMVGMALVLYAEDRDNLIPQDLSAIAASHYLDRPPSVFVCPGDKARMVSKTSSWNSFNLTNATYLLIAPGVRLDPNKTNDLVWCPIHQQLAFRHGTTLRTRRGPLNAP